MMRTKTILQNVFLLLACIIRVSASRESGASSLDADASAAPDNTVDTEFHKEARIPESTSAKIAQQDTELDDDEEADDEDEYDNEYENEEDDQDDHDGDSFFEADQNEQNPRVIQRRGYKTNTNAGFLVDFHQDLKCSDFHHTASPIHDDATWVFMRSVYNAIVGPSNSTLPNDDLYGSGWSVPVYVGHHPFMGRGVFAQQFIAQGTPIWRNKYTARFTQGWQFRNFLLTLPRQLSCDVLIWSYVIQLDSGVQACTDLDAGSFVNQALREGEANTGLEFAPNAHLSATATKDIVPGEQLIAEYGDFSYPSGWYNLGLSQWW
mmetsp:Transcript_1601/g.4377  ORF Transcript_1601/g.4377 Transcript_1601/m.4377 type:complete len:321 (-) Transcript_1601:287-1249(-)